MVWLVALKCAGLVLVFEPFSLSAFDLPKSVFSRATEWLILAGLLLALYRYGLSILPRSWLHVPVALLLVVNVAATVFAVNPYVALYGEFERYLGLAFIVDMAVLYAAVAIACRNAADWILILRVGAIGTLLLIVYALIQYVGLDPIEWGERPIRRPWSTFGNRDMLGRFLSVAFGVTLGIAISHGRDLSPARRIALAAFLGALVVMAGTITVRSALLGFAASLVVATFLYFSRSGRGLRVRVVIASVGALVLLGLVGTSPLGERVLATAGRWEQEARPVIYRAAIAALERRPVLGYGPDSFAVAWAANRDETSALRLNLERESSAHSWLFQSLATVGVTGTVALIALIALASWSLWRSAVRARWLAGPMLVGLAAYWADGLVAVGTIGVDWFPWLAFGAAAMLDGRRAPLPALRPVRMLAGATVFATTIIGGSLGLVALAAGERMWQARLLSDAKEAIARAEQAVLLDPARPDYWNWLGLVRERAHEVRLGGDAYAEATRLAPYDPLFWSNLALSRASQALAGDTSSGGGAAAIDAARKAVAADPNGPEAHATLGYVATQFGEPDAGLSAAVRAVVLYPIDPAYDELVLAASRAANDLPAAAQALERALKAKDSVPLRIAAGEIALRRGDTATARAHAERAAQLAPGNPDVVKLLAATSKG